MFLLLAVGLIFPPPFRLRLEDVDGMNPSIYRTVDYYTDISKYTKKPIRCAVSVTGHVLVAHPVCDDDFDIDERSPLDKYVSAKGVDELCLVDGVRLFSSSVPTFRCFVTGELSSEGIGLRIQDTCTWLLASTCFDLVECNELACRINRREFSDIQRGFVKLLATA